MDVRMRCAVGWTCIRRRSWRVRRPSAGRRVSEVRTYGTTTGQLLELVDWLADRQVTHVAMESTGYCGKPGPQSARGSRRRAAGERAPRRPSPKTDVQDCAWLAELLEHWTAAPELHPAPPRP